MEDKHILIVEISVDGRKLRQYRLTSPSLGILLYAAEIAYAVGVSAVKQIKDIIEKMDARYVENAPQGGETDGE